MIIDIILQHQSCSTKVSNELLPERQCGHSREVTNNYNPINPKRTTDACNVQDTVIVGKKKKKVLAKASKVFHYFRFVNFIQIFSVLQFASLQNQDITQFFSFTK